MGLLGLLKTAASNIPWSRVVQSTPLLVETLGRARERLRQNDASQRDLEEHLKLLQEENAKLTTAVLHLSQNLQSLSSRVTLMTTVSAVSLILALASMIIALAK